MTKTKTAGSNYYLDRHYGPLIGWLQQLLEVVVTVGVLYGAVYWRDGYFHQRYYLLVLLTVLLLLLLYRMGGVYRQPGLSHFIYQVGLVLRSWGLVLGVLLLVGWLTKSTADYSRHALLIWSGGAFLAQVMVHGLTGFVLDWIRQKEHSFKRALIVASKTDALELAEKMRANRWYGTSPLGYLDVQSARCEADGFCLGGTEQLAEILEQKQIETVYLHLPLKQSGLLSEWMQVLLRANISVHWVPQLTVLGLLTQSVHELGGLPVFCLSDSPLDGTQRALKSLLDKVLSLLLLILLAGLFLLLAGAVRFSSKGPVLFRQKRVGLGGKHFLLYKFRTMHLHTEKKNQLKSASKGDARFTTVGWLLRTTSLDELPQLLNVLRGDMSLVGPRPHALLHDEDYERKLSTYVLRHRIKPGITGWAQVNGYRGEVDQPEKILKRVEYDLYYIKHWSFWFDIVILVRTFWAVLVRKNAY